METNVAASAAVLAIVSPPTGSDGYPPIYDPDSRFAIWALQEVYIGKEGMRRYVPKVNDYVVNYETDEWYRVSHLDLTTMLSTLEPIIRIGEGSFTPADLLLGVGPGTQADTYRIYINSNTKPALLTIDQRLTITGTESVSAQIFVGSDLTGSSELLGVMYDANGNLLGSNIPLELVKMNALINYTEKSVPSCYATRDCLDGEVATVVFYSASGRVTSKRQLLVENTAFIRGPDMAQKYIIGIELQSPFMSQGNPDLMQYPLNVPLNGMNLFGVVHYSDGSSMRRPVDGTKFELYGMEKFVATVIGQQFPLVLKYNLSPGEVNYTPGTTDPSFVPKNYSAITVKAEGAYTVKLFGYPVWVDQANGYRLEWYLYNLDRRVYSRCTSNVRLSKNGPAWNPLGYGTNQALRVEVNLRDVNGIYKDYLHAQTVTFTLVRPAVDTEGTNWMVGFDPGQNPAFGVNTVARTTFVNSNFTRLRLDAGTNVFDTWLSRMYRDIRPLVDGSKEVEAPVPTIMVLMVGNSQIEVPMSQWNSEIIVNQTIPDASTLFVRFIKRTAENDIELGIAGYPVHQN